jgi:hypothetical protein
VLRDHRLGSSVSFTGSSCASWICTQPDCASAWCLPLVSCGFSVDSFFFVIVFGDRILDPLFPARVCIPVLDLLPYSMSVEIISAPRFSSPAQGVRRAIFWFPPRSAGTARQVSSRGLRCSALSACSCALLGDLPPR